MKSPPIPRASWDEDLTAEKAGVRLSPPDAGDGLDQRQEWWKQLYPAPHWHQKGHERRWLGDLSVRLCARSVRTETGVREGRFV